MAGATALRVAGTHEEPVRPGVKARRVAELRKVPPDGDQRLLGRVLGEIDVAQDPARHGEEPGREAGGEQPEGRPIAALRPDHEIGLHALTRSCGAGSDPAHSHGMGRRPDGTFNVRRGSSRQGIDRRRSDGSMAIAGWRMELERSLAPYGWRVNEVGLEHCRQGDLVDEAVALGGAGAARSDPVERQQVAVDGVSERQAALPRLPVTAAKFERSNR